MVDVKQKLGDSHTQTQNDLSSIDQMYQGNSLAMANLKSYNNCRGKVKITSIEKKYLRKNELFLQEYKNKLDSARYAKKTGFTDSNDNSLSQLVNTISNSNSNSSWDNLKSQNVAERRLEYKVSPSHQ